MPNPTVLTKDEFKEHIVWSGCPTHCEGNVHVGVTCSYIIGEVPDLNLMVKFDGYRSMHKNREVVLDTLYKLYLQC